MRPDQIARLAELEDELIDVVLDEADPKTWPGAGQPLADMSRDDRGDLLWTKRNAAATLAIVQRVQLLRGGSQQPDTREADDMNDAIAKAERDAAKILDRLVRGKA